MYNIHVILPHIKKYGGVRRYLELGNALLKLNKNIQYNIWLIQYSKDYDWISELKFKGNIRNINKINEYDFYNSDYPNVVICGDASSLKNIEKFKNVDLKIINVIFPIDSNYKLGDYSEYLYNNDGKTIVVGNSTGWNDSIEKYSHHYTIPGAVNTDMFYPLQNKKDDNFSVLFMAKNRPWKGYDKFLKLIKTLKQTQTEVKFSYFDTEYHKELDELNVSAHINLPQNQMKKVYCSHSCFLSLEQLAGWQNTVAEAMACKIPTITTPTGTRDISIHNKTSLVLQKSNDENFVEELITYLFLLRKNTMFGETLANNGYEHIKNFTWDEYAKKYVELIETALINSKETQTVINTNNKNFDNDSKEKTITEDFSEEKKAIRQKSNDLIKYLEMYSNTKKSLLFDKYERFGAYHWNSEHDKPYHTYINYLIKSLEAINEFYGDDLKMLDVGGGDGFISYKLKDYVRSIDIVDTNKTAIELASKKLANHKDKIQVYNLDFFDIDLSKYDILLLSQIIEHFESPESLIDKIYEYRNDIQLVIISTPLARKDGKMWDPYYHAQEFYCEDLLELTKKLNADFITTVSVIEPHNQILVLENKVKSLSTYVENLFFNPDFQPDKSLIPDIVQSLINMAGDSPKISYFGKEKS